jgi:general secretion pathway protein I
MTARHHQGFTLIEMVIAFAILGLSLSVLYGAFENSLARTRHDVRLSEAILFAQSLLARAGTEWPLGGDARSGDSAGYTYQLTQQPVLPTDGKPPFTLPETRVTASVSWSEAAGSRTIALSTIKWLPKDKP